MTGCPLESQFTMLALGIKGYEDYLEEKIEEVARDLRGDALVV